MPDPELLLLDANVLIDYASSELRVLSLAAQWLGPVHVPRPLLREVEQLGEEQCDELGLRLLDPSLEQILEAGQAHGPLSFADRLCLALARDGSFVRVTNDRRLRKECAQKGVGVLWGLELMVELVKLQRLRQATAIRVARSIQASNPLHITEAIVARFERKVLSLSLRKPPSR